MLDSQHQLPTPVLECPYEHIEHPKRHLTLASTIYHTVLVSVVVVALAILVMVQAGVIDVGDDDDQDDWAEVSSQIINGVFAWIAITNQPFYIHRLVMTSRVLKATGCGDNSDAGMGPSIRAAWSLSKHFPFVFVDKVSIRGDLETQDNGDSTGFAMASLNENDVECIGGITFHGNDAKHLRRTFIILNSGCLFQYIMSGYMWGYDESSRPGFVLPALLPPAILCNVVGQYRLYQLRKRSKDRQIISAF